MNQRAPKKGKPKKPKPTLVEQRLISGATIMKTASEDAPRGAFYTFRADIVERLIAAGKLTPRGDGLFSDDAQTWVYA